MKNCLTILFLLLSLPVWCQSNLGMEYGVDKEIKQVILNHRSFNAKHLKIEFENFQGEIYSMRFKFLTDSTFSYRNKRYKSEHVIRGNEIFNFGKSLVKNTEETLSDTQVFKSTEKNGIVTGSLYYVFETDTLLYSIQSTEIDSIENSTTSITKYRNGKDWTGFKQVETQISDDLIRTQNFSLVNNTRWEMKLDKMDIILKSRTEFSKTKILLSKGKSANEDEDNEEEFSTIDTERKSVRHYNGRGLIEAVVIVNQDHEEYFENKRVEYLILYPRF